MPESLPPQADTARPRSRRRRLPVSRPRGEDAGFLVVGIGASAGGLEACRKLIDALPADNGMSFVLIQHLDPSHESMMVDLLAEHTSMPVLQATDGMPLEREHLYVIAPGTYLSVGNSALHVSEPDARHGARMPFDFLLHSLAEEYGARAVCIILSGTGSDGSLGLKAIGKKCGLVIAQDPNEAAYDGMPRSAIMTDGVDLVLPVARIPAALTEFRRRTAASATMQDSPPARDPKPDGLPMIIDLLRTKTGHDFTLYKPGTLQRRISRRMALAAIEADDMGRYIAILRNDGEELELLAKDLLINVTGFFRDPEVFDFLARTIVPELIGSRTAGQSLRIWIAGCSTGEETYSLAMLFREQIAAAGSEVKLQIFASDIDPDAVARAREGLYPETIEADVSPTRLARFFAPEDHHYRVLPELRSAVVFTVHDVLADPPFSRLDLVSCRNLLIYLRPDAQAKVVSLLHFSLREGGILLLGSAETVSDVEGRFELVSKAERVYRHIGRSRLGDFGLTVGSRQTALLPVREEQVHHARSREAQIAELCRRLVLETYAPAAVLINRSHECLYFLGPTDRYLRVAPGPPTHDLLAMAPDGIRTRLRSALQQSGQGNVRIVVTGGTTTHDGKVVLFNIDVRPVMCEAESLLLIGFIDLPEHALAGTLPITPTELSRVAELEHELEATRSELQGAIRNLEISSEEQKAINEEARSVNEEYQSTNEELLTSKEELQSLNEELTALNSQLQETLDRQRTTYNDLQNVLYSTDVATLFLDTDLNIRFFTPATKLLFSVLPGDIGRPLADLRALAADGALLVDARTVLQTAAPLEREIEARNAVWFIRRILPYRTHDNGVEGVVITFTDITERKLAARALESARQLAEQANVAKSRFLAAASHDLRQPLQTLALLHSLLAKLVQGDERQKIIARLDQTLGAMSGMLNTLLDINQIEAGTVHAEIVSFPVNDLLAPLRDEFSYQAEAQGITLRFVPCHLSIRSDPRLLDQVIRNLLANALKYTPRGKVLLGCRRHEGMVSIEIWDTGIGIPPNELDAIFDEYHQLDNAARERHRGLGLGLSIARSLAHLMGHRIRVRSQPRKGSVFKIEVGHSVGEATPSHASRRPVSPEGAVEDVHRTGAILVVEDDPEVRGLLEVLLTDEGHRAAAAPDGIAAMEWVTRDTFRPDLILADYNLPNGMDGLQVAAKIREALHRQIPVIILTGDISTGALRAIARENCVQFNKPVQLAALTQSIQHLLAALPPSPPAITPHLIEMAGDQGPPVIFVVDDDSHVCGAIRAVLEEDGQTVETYASCEAFLASYCPGREACLLIDAYLPAMSGLELLERLRDTRQPLPAIMITGHSDVSMAVRAMKAGAADFIEKPIGRIELLDGIKRAFEQSRDSNKLLAWRERAARHVASLTQRQRQIMDQVLAGQPSKVIAADLGISQRTVENHRAAIMKKTGLASLPALARLALAAAWNDAEAKLVRDEVAGAAARRIDGG